MSRISLLTALVLLALLSVPSVFAAAAAPPVAYLDWDPMTGELREWARVNVAATEEYRNGATFDGEYLAWYHPEGNGSILRVMKGAHGNVDLIPRDERVFAGSLWKDSLYLAEVSHPDRQGFHNQKSVASLRELRLSDGVVVDLDIKFQAPYQIFLDRGMAAWSSPPTAAQERFFLYDLSLRRFVWSNVSAGDLGFDEETVDFLGLVGGHAQFAADGVYSYRNLSTNKTIELSAETLTTPFGIDGSTVFWVRAPEQWFVSEGAGPLRALPAMNYAPENPFQMSKGRVLVADHWNPKWGERPGVNESKTPIAIPSLTAFWTVLVGVVLALRCRTTR